MTELARIRFTPRIIEVRRYTAICDELGLSGSGETREIATDQLRSCIVSYGRAMRRTGQWWQALEESGLTWERVSLDSAEGEAVIDA